MRRSYSLYTTFILPENLYDTSDTDTEKHRTLSNFFVYHITCYSLDASDTLHFMPVSQSDTKFQFSAVVMIHHAPMLHGENAFADRKYRSAAALFFNQPGVRLRIAAIA